MNFPPDSYLSWLVFIVLVLILLYLYLLPKRIHDEAIVKLENKLAIELTEIRNKLDKETDLIKIIRSQVEPQKVNTYLAITDLYSEMISSQIVNQDLNPLQMQNELKNKKELCQLLSRLYFFASDNTIPKWLTLKNDRAVPSQDVIPSQSFKLFADFVASMRQDLHENTKLKGQDFIDVLITWKPKEESENKKQ